MRRILLIGGVFALFLMYCSNTTEPDEGFEAQNSDFANYSSWDMIDYNVAPTATISGGAHQGQSAEFARAVYASEERNMDGTYSEGAILVKEVFTFDDNGDKQYADGTGLLAMVKRGGEFNPDNGGWEYFLLDPDNNSITGRGAELNNGGCQSCHASAAQDFVFEHPVAFEPSVPDVASDWTSWFKIDSTRGPDPAGLLSNFAHGADTTFDRIVYTNTQAFQPLGGVYPTGTVIVKELRDKDTGDLAGSVTMLVKRGGDFNPDGNGWEWVMATPDLSTVQAQGGNNDQSTAGCVGCHAAANSNDNGVDWVFTHPRP